MTTQEAYDKGYRAALKDVLDYLELIGGPDMEQLIKQIRYKTAKGVDFDYPWDDGETM